jgi:hypothetical protein
MPLTKEGLQELAAEANCRITDEDFDRAEMSAAEEEALIELMTDRGYTIGLDEDHRNEWWPPEKKKRPGSSSPEGKRA